MNNNYLGRNHQAQLFCIKKEDCKSLEIWYMNPVICKTIVLLHVQFIENYVSLPQKWKLTAAILVLHKKINWKNSRFSKSRVIFCIRVILSNGNHLKDPWSFISSFNTISSVMCLSFRLVTRIHFHLIVKEINFSLSEINNHSQQILKRWILLTKSTECNNKRLHPSVITNQIWIETLITYIQQNLPDQGQFNQNFRIISLLIC
jgi:hypothetical protein